MASGVRPFAFDEELVKPVRSGQRTVSSPTTPFLFLSPSDSIPKFWQVDIRVFNTNTQQLLVETVHVRPEGKFSEDGNYNIAGVRGFASPLRMTFIQLGCSMTGRLFPSGAKQEMLTVNSAHPPTPFMIRASLVDAPTLSCS